MKTRLLLIAVLTAMSCSLHAQTKDSTTLSNDVVFNGYTIRVFKTTGAGYGYNIFYQNRLKIRQERNPFTNAPGGLKIKDDALRVAKWQVIHLNPADQRMAQSPQTVPIEVAHQLNITLN